MPCRLIRDEMLDSERLQVLPIEARWLFVAIMLTADDVGLLELAPFKLSRRAAIDAATVPMLIQLLSDADLIRVYEHGGRRFAFIPRFRQRLQIKRVKHPLPPAALLADDEDASSKINNLGEKQPLYNREQPLSTAAQPSEPEPEPEPERNTPPNPRKRGNEPPGFARFWKAWPAGSRKVARPQCLRRWERAGCEAFADRVVAAVEAFKGSADWLKNGGEFIPAPLVWLNQSRWEAAESLTVAPAAPGLEAANAELQRARDQAARAVPPPPGLLARVKQSVRTV